MRFQGRVAVVTGAAAGFGLAVSTRLTNEGAKVVMVDRVAEALEKAAAGLADALPVVADVSVESEVDGYVVRAVRAHGEIDLFFNNAGIEGRMAPMTELPVADFDRVWAVNGRGVFLGLRAVLKVMKAQGRRDREHRLAGRDPWRGDVFPLRGGKTRGRRADLLCRAGGCPVRHPGQRPRAR